VVSIRLALLAGCFVLVSGGAWLLKPELTTIIILTAAYVFLESFYHSLGALFLGLKRVIERVITSISAKLLLVVLVFGVINGQGTLNLILISYIVANTYLVGFALQRVRTHIGPPRLSWRVDSMRNVLSISFPLFILTILSLIHFKVDTLMLGFLQPYTAVANYEAGFKLLEISRFVIRPAVMIFFPICTEMVVRQNWSELQILSRKIFLTTAALGIGIGLLVVAIAGLVIPLVFGPQYDEAIPVLRVLYLSLPALYLGMISLFLARSLHLEKQAIKILSIGVLLNLGLNMLAIPLWGTLGAAITTVISETTLTAWLVRLIWQNLQERSQAKPDSWPTPVSRSAILLTK
jgi:O-antigen/teichoic acid export membrane protein